MNQNKQLVNENRLVVLSRVLFCFFVFLIPYAMYRFFFRPDLTTNIVAIITILILTALASFLLTNRAKKNIKANPMAEVLVVKTNRIRKRMSSDENDHSFYVDVVHEGKPKVLFLQNLFVNEKESDNLFPNTDFEIIKNPETQEILEVITKGRFFKPEKTLSPFTEKDFEENRIPEDCEVLETTIDHIV